MRKNRFTDEQIAAILQESAAGAKTGELIRRTWMDEPLKSC